MPFVLLLGVAALVPPSSPALASAAQEEDDDDCPDGWVDEYGRCHPEAEQPAPTPGDPGGPGGPDAPTPRPGPGTDDGGSDSGEPDPNRCEWTPLTDEAYWRDMYPQAPPDAVFGVWACYRNNRYYSVGVMWVVPQPTMLETTETVVDPGAVAQMLWARARATLDVPQVAMRPPTVSYVRIPTFFEVTNWQGTQTETGCASAPCNCAVVVCVTLTATPSLAVDPGEPGARAVTCEGAGTRYDESSPEPDVLAARPGACTHTYERHTAVCTFGRSSPRRGPQYDDASCEPRPDRSLRDGQRRQRVATGGRDRCAHTPTRWPDDPYTVTACIRWTIHWEANNGMQGDIPAITMEGTAERHTVEIHTVVSDVG